MTTASEQLENQEYIREIKKSDRLWLDNLYFNEYPEGSEFDPYEFDLMDDDDYMCDDCHKVIVIQKFKPLTIGTTCTTQSIDGVYSTPVFYDWGANWEQVCKIISRPDVQESLKESIEGSIKKANKHIFTAREVLEWNADINFPFLYSSSLRRNYIMQAWLKKRFLSRELLKHFNGRIANWYDCLGRRLIKEEQISLYDYMDENDIFGNLMDHFKSGKKLKQVISNLVYNELFKSDGPLRELLLFSPTQTNAFKPFLFILATILSPPGTKLTTYQSESYCVVVDKKRNIVFDNDLYFSSAEEWCNCDDHSCQCCSIYKALDRVQWTPTIIDVGGCKEEDWPQDNVSIRPALRFGVGTRVKCRIGHISWGVRKWVKGVITRLWCRDEKWPGNSYAAYEVLLRDGRLVYVPCDICSLIKQDNDDMYRLRIASLFS